MNKTITSKEHYDKMMDILPKWIPVEIRNTLALQSISTHSNINPIHINLLCDRDIATELANLLYESRRDVLYLKRTRNKVKQMKHSSNINLSILYNSTDKPLKVTDVNKFENNLQMNRIKNLPKNIPLLIINSPRDDYINDYDSINKQMNLDKEIFYNVDISYTMTDIDVTPYEISDMIDDKSITNKNCIKSDLDISDTLTLYSDTNNNKPNIPITCNKLQQTANKLSFTNDCINKYDNKEIVNDILQKSMRDMGLYTEGDRYDVNVESDTSVTSQRDRHELLKETIETCEDEGEKGAPRELIMEIMVVTNDFEEETIEHDLNKLCRNGDDIYEPKKNEYALF